MWKQNGKKSSNVLIQWEVTFIRWKLDVVNKIKIFIQLWFVLEKWSFLCVLKLLKKSDGNNRK
jgi:hypothetical protein